MPRAIIIAALSIFLLLLSQVGVKAEEQRFILYPTQDTLTKRWYPTSSSYLTRDLSVGYDGVIPRRNTRTYLKFDYSVLQEAGVLLEDLHSAKLYLSEYRELTGGQYDVELFEPTALWVDKELNWSNQPPLPNLRYTQRVNFPDTRVEAFDVTQIFLDQMPDSLRWGRGFGIKMVDEEAPGALFWSKDCVNFTDSPRCNLSQLPYLEVVFGEETLLQPAEILSPANYSYTQNEQVEFEWRHNIKAGIEFQLVIEKGQHELYRSEWQTATSHQLTLPDDGQYSWYISSRRTDNPNESFSSRQNLVLDRTSPQGAYFSFPIQDLYTNSRSLMPKLAGLEAGGTYELYLNGTIISNPSEEVVLTVEGENTFKAVIKDQAGNSTETSVRFTTDWSAPPKPGLELVADPLLKGISLNVKAEEYDTVAIYQGETKISQLSSAHNLVGINVVNGWKGGKSYSYSVQAIDRAGNLSELSEVVKYNTPTEAVLGASEIANEESRSVLGATAAVADQSAGCQINVNLDLKKVKVASCNFPAPKLADLAQIKVDEKSFWIQAVSHFKRVVSLEVNYYKCKLPVTVANLPEYLCLPYYLKQEKIFTDSIGAALLSIEGSQLKEYQTYSVEGSQHSLFSSGVSYKDKQASIGYEVHLTTKLQGNMWMKISGKSANSNAASIRQTEDRTVKSKSFRFPFSKNIGVTQWWGKTAFSSHHTGIDFGSSKEKAYAIANGKVAFVGWDSYNGPCLSGGNIVRIEHANGMNSLYMHLESYTKADGTPWRAGESVKKGDQVGITGNTGAYNCQPLASHLHFEIRDKKEQSSNTDPVPHIDVDWNRIPTLGIDRHPGRLTGNNPHPNF